MRLYSAGVFTAVAMLLAGTDARAQAALRTDVPEIVTDRPDFTESSEVVPAGWLQFESGARLEGTASLRSFSAPAALLRIGLGRRAEVRLAAEGFLSEAVGDFRHSGRSDVEISAKYNLVDQRMRGFDLALLPIVSLPMGNDGFSSGGIDPTLKVAWGRDLPAGFGLTGNLNVSYLTEDGARFHQHAVSLSMGHGLPLGFGGYAEVYRISKVSASEGAGVIVNGGVSRLVGRHVQVDLEAGRGLSAPGPDWFIGFGLAVIGPQPRR